MTLPPERSIALAAALGDELVQLLDRRARLYHDLVALDADIYAALVNRLQSQTGAAMVRPYEALSARLDLKRTKIADLRMIVEELAQRVEVLERRNV